MLIENEYVICKADFLNEGQISSLQYEPEELWISVLLDSTCSYKKIFLP